MKNNIINIKMCKANLTIIDKINSTESIKKPYVYEFFKFKRYNNLFVDLPNILSKLECKKTNYAKCQISFSFFHLNVFQPVEKWSSYILHNEKIIITIENPPPCYFLVDSFDKSIIFKSKNIKELYRYYNTHLKNKLDYPVLLRNNLKLIDVLDEGIVYYNLCVNRLVHSRNY